MKLDSSERRKAIKFATSSGFPLRFNGCASCSGFACVVSESPDALLASATIGVSIVPLQKCQSTLISSEAESARGTYGAIAFTLMFLSPTSFAADLTNPITPCLLAVYAPLFALPDEADQHKSFRSSKRIHNSPDTPAILLAHTIDPPSAIRRS